MYNLQKSTIIQSFTHLTNSSKITLEVLQDWNQINSSVGIHLIRFPNQPSLPLLSTLNLYKHQLM